MSIVDRFIRRLASRNPDVVIGGADRPYLRRWFVIPRNRFLNVYLHQFLRSDDDRAHHDHPWVNLSILLRGEYVEHTIAAGGIEHRKHLIAGNWRFRWTGRFAHRIALLTVADFVASQPENKAPMPCWTLFITGPRYRQWGFHCPRQGWIHWARFTASDDPGAVGKGCDA